MSNEPFQTVGPQVVIPTTPERAVRLIRRTHHDLRLLPAPFEDATHQEEFMNLGGLQLTSFTWDPDPMVLRA